MKKYYVIHPSVFKLDGGAMFGIIPKPLWSKFIAADELNRIQMSLRIMLIQTKSKNILIDTGIGDYHGEKFDSRFGVQGEKDPLVKTLENNYGIKAHEITDLIISHLHFDHVGGLGKQESEYHSLFPDAMLHVHRKHYEYALNPTLRDTGSFHGQYFRPLIEMAQEKGKVHWLEGEEGVILNDEGEELRFKCSHGHTPYLVHPYDDKFIYMADLVPTSVHIPVPWVMGYDIAPGKTTIDKVNFYNFIMERNLTMIFEHDMNVWGAKIKKKKNEEFEAAEIFMVDSLDPVKSELTFH